MTDGCRTKVGQRSDKSSTNVGRNDKVQDVRAQDGNTIGRRTTWRKTTVRRAQDNRVHDIKTTRRQCKRMARWSTSGHQVIGWNWHWTKIEWTYDESPTKNGCR